MQTHSSEQEKGRIWVEFTALLHESVMGWFLSMVFSFQVPSSTL